LVSLALIYPRHERVHMAVSEHLVGRAAELDSFDSLLDELERGRARALELVGEPGIGKTRLLAELAARADVRGCVVLAGSASELESDLPFSVFVDALDEYVQGLERQRLALLDDDVRAELAQVLPSLPAVVAAGRSVPIQHERYRAHRAVRALLEQVAATKALVLVLDDLHWADPGSVELVGALLRRPPSAPVLMAVAVRPRQVPDRLSSALERARRAGRLTRLELGALTLGEAWELLGAGRDRASASALYEESGGNPFYLEELARSLDRAGSGPSGHGISPEGLEVPITVAVSMNEELSLLTDRARVVLEGAAVAGDPFEPDLAAAAASTSEESALEALDELLRCDLVRATDVPRRFRFRHPLVRRAVYESTAAGWRLGAHERCAQLLAARGASATSRAHHVERSAAPGDPAAVATLRAAGDAAAHRAPASAARWYDAALRLLPESAPSEERVELLLASAEALGATGRYQDGHRALQESLAIVPAESIDLRTRLTASCSRMERLLGKHDAAHDRLAGALDSLRDRSSPEAVALMIELVIDASFRIDYVTARRWATEAVEAARRLEDPPLTAAAVAALALSGSLGEAGAPAEAERLEAAALVDALTDEELSLRLDAAANLAGAELFLDHFAEAEAHAERVLSVGRATGQGQLFRYAYAVLGFAWLVRGELDKAVVELDAAIESERLADDPQALPWNLFSRSTVALLVGDVETALEHARESVELTSDLAGSHISALSAVALAAVELEMGQAEDAVERLVKSTGGEELTLVPGGSWRFQGLELLTRCRLALGRLDEARSTAQVAEAAAAAVGLPYAAALAQRAAATVSLDSGQPDDAARQALASAVCAEEIGAGIDGALSRLLASRALAQAGARDHAVAELERAAAAFDSFGALRYRAQAERELRKLGRTIHRRTAHGTAAGGIASLTKRELQLARLVVDRKTNTQIADELFLSRKTVETHLRNIFRKLGVANRVELARAFEQADRAESAAPR
jgi:predicted ATPase/DNA-binding CsgD family transcriptional regulator